MPQSWSTECARTAFQDRQSWPEHGRPRLGGWGVVEMVGRAGDRRRPRERLGLREGPGEEETRGVTWCGYGVSHELWYYWRLEGRGASLVRWYYRAKVQSLRLELR